MKDTSIIIQGPLHENSISNIDIYKKYGDIIFVSWSDEYNKNLSLIQEIKKSGAFLLLLERPRWLRENRQNIALQCYSTSSGLLLSDKKYSIKLRSDEQYTNLDPLIQKMYSSDKIITSNIFFRKHNEYPLHISDHMIAGKTRILSSIFQNCVTFCSNATRWISQHKTVIKNFTHSFVAEQLITASSISVLHTDTNNPVDYLDKTSCYNYLINNFDIINIEDLGEFIVSYSRNGERYFSTSLKTFTDKKTDVIYSIEEYI